MKTSFYFTSKSNKKKRLCKLPRLTCQQIFLINDNENNVAL